MRQLGEVLGFGTVNGASQRKNAAAREFDLEKLWQISDDNLACIVSRVNKEDCRSHDVLIAPLRCNLGNYKALCSLDGSVGESVHVCTRC